MQIYIFTDGASKGNPGPGGWGALIVTEKSVLELGGGELETTNNRMELTAAIEAINLADVEGSLHIFSDSTYLIQGITSWIFGWEKNNWKTKAKSEVLNVDLWQRLRALTKDRDIIWTYVPGHSDVAGNERANDIAEGFALKSEIRLYNGKRGEYPVRLLDGNTPLDREGNPGKLKKDDTASKKKAGAAFSYVSLLDGKIEVHKTWDECRRRVDGKPARFRKALSAEDEKKIIAEFKK